MKRLILTVCIVVGFLLFPITIRAQGSAIYGDFSEELSALYEAMPEEVRIRFSDVLSDSAGVETLRDEMDLASFLSRARDALDDVWPSAFSLLLRLFGLILCTGVFAGLHTALDTRAATEALTLCTTMCFALALTGTMDTLMSNVVLYLNGLTELVSGMAPVVCAVLAASGQITAAAVSHTSLMLLFTLFQNIANILLIPMVRITYCFGVIGAIGGPVKLENITKCIRKVFATLLSFLVVVFIFVVSVQTALAKGADSLSVRTVKFALGNVIPLIGSALSDAITTVAGSLTLIRSVTGSLGIFSLVVLVLPVLLQLLLYRLVFGISKGAAEMVGCEREGKLIGEMHAAVGFLLAGVALISVLFLFILSLFTLIGGGGV